ncbi:hypothetical protein RAA17_14435 [Komagataeibacter rhaeticus]|nr:hypothetical protein [Komagataeibacter rhaeticus]
MAITFQSFKTTLGNMVASAQGACPSLLDLNVGSPAAPCSKRWRGWGCGSSSSRSRSFRARGLPPPSVRMWTVSCRISA